ncbi:MAG: HlyD family type I secretion periplasmic adaptor subunit [Pseudomonadota bacterium]
MAREDLEFANDPAGAVDSSGTGTGWRVLLVIGTLLACAIGWAAWAEVEQVTSGQGKVIPSSQVQAVESLEPGLVAEILIQEGSRVEAGQELIRIDDTGASSRQGELKGRQAALLAERARLRAHLEGDADLPMPDGLSTSAQAAFRDQQSVFRANVKRLADQQVVRRSQLAQKEQSLAEATAKAAQTQGLLNLANRELALIRRLFRRKAVPEIDFIRVQRESTKLSGDLKIWQATKARLEAEVAEARALVDADLVSFTADNTARLSTVNADLAIIEQTLLAATDTVERTVLRSPVRGVVNKVNVAAINEVVRAGDSVVEIVPLDDRLLIEAQIRPQDIAFIRAGLKATIRISAFDYTRYGTLSGTVERIGADTITNDNRETFYQVTIGTDGRESDGVNTADLDIIPGMIATVDIATGKRSVLEYLLKPILVLRDQALRDPR